MEFDARGSQPPRLVAGFPADIQGQLDRALTPSCFSAGHMLQRPGERVRRCLVIETGLVSFVLPGPGGANLIEVGTAGPGGLIGWSAAFGMPPPSHAVRAQSAGRAWQVEADLLRALILSSQALREALLRYTGDMLEQAHERTACAMRHSLDQRVARWILVAAHHLGGIPIHITHDELGELLNVRRASITIALHRLEGEHAIFSQRGAIRVRDRLALERCSCGCCRVAPLSPWLARAEAPGKVAAPPRPALHSDLTGFSSSAATSPNGASPPFPAMQGSNAARADSRSGRAGSADPVSSLDRRH